ncbi:MAG: ArgR family transcriptional regulator [Acidobacteria bacterium]|nr:MAG: ArgR family transcriptional regulator [Acidobacteriota bacterium]
MDKLYRRTQILDLLRAEPVATQTDLRRKLGRRGIRVTQATVSRDIEELGVVKTREGYRLPLRDVRQAANLVILKTHPGNAHTVAVALDAVPWPEVMGTVAGDDTIFVATHSVREAARVRKKFMDLLAI